MGYGNVDIRTDALFVICESLILGDNFSEEWLVRLDP